MATRQKVAAGWAASTSSRHQATERNEAGVRERKRRCARKKGNKKGKKERKKGEEEKEKEKEQGNSQLEETRQLRGHRHTDIRNVENQKCHVAGRESGGAG